jgi:hypothetical protein
MQGTNEGLAAARARGRVGGRPTVVNDKLLRAARDMLPNPENSAITSADRPVILRSLVIAARDAFPTTRP